MRDRLLPAVMLAIMTVTTPALAGADTVKSRPTGQQLASAQSKESTVTAAIVPGAGRDARIVPLPKPLSAEDARIYAQVFKLQESGQWVAALGELEHVRNGVLKGYALARHYLRSGQHPRYQDLRAWMADYGDQPQAADIYRLATRKGVKGFGTINRPSTSYLRGTGIDTSDDGANWEADAFSGERGSSRVQALKSRFRQAARTSPDAAARQLTGRDMAGLSPLEADELKVAVAGQFFSLGEDDDASRWAEEAAARSGDELPGAHWVAGLSLWRKGNPDAARRHFEEVANATGSGWMISAGAFWAARANLVAGRPEVVNHWLEVAATYPRTFYGLLARRALGYEAFFSWETPPFTEGDADVLARVPGGRRALALLQLGQTAAAEEELRRAYPDATKPVRQAMLALAHAGNMPGLAVRLGGMVPDADGRASDAASFPVPNWSPKGGWQVDKALVFAFVRQESAFNPSAKSQAGARGLMQIMPSTATFLGGRKANESLGDPEYNLGLGQSYIARLLGDESVNGNLLHLAVAYNAGPGNLSKWLTTMKHGNDPLLFIESIPSRETRAFAERVMTNYWIYRSRMGQPSGSLDAVAAGEWPFYEAHDDNGGLRRASTSRN